MALLPSYALRWIPDAKIRDYLLVLEHPEGGSKANFFINVAGFSRAKWEVLRDALNAQVLLGDARMTRVDEYGERWEVTGPIAAPNSKNYTVISGWVIRRDDARPQFVTAFPDPKYRQN